MDAIITSYHKLLDLIDEEKHMLNSAVQSEINVGYEKILSQEYEKIKIQIEKIKIFNL